MLARFVIGFFTLGLVAAVSAQANAQSSAVTILAQAQSEDVTPPVPLMPLEIADGDYPIQSLLRNEGGNVSLNLLIDSQGKVTFAQMLKSSGSTYLDDDARQIATLKWKFRPALKNGNPVGGSLKVEVKWIPPLALADEYKSNIPAMASMARDERFDFKPSLPTTSHLIRESDYPAVSIRQGEQGVVYLRYLILEDGTVGDIKIEQSSLSSNLDNAASNMVKQRWRFRPATLNDNPVQMWASVEVIWCLNKCFDTSRMCKPSPNLGDSMQMSAKGGAADVKISQWLHIAESGEVDRLIVQTDDGWMRASDAIVHHFSEALHYPNARAGKRPASCWYNGSVTVKAK